MRALIVDDSSAMRGIIGRILRSVGFEVTQAENGAVALERLREAGAPDVVLVDWNMPVMNGLEFVRTVRQDPAFRELPIMMVTTETELERVEAALLAGANEYLMKPFTRDAIVEKLELLGLQVEIAA